MKTTLRYLIPLALAVLPARHAGANDSFIWIRVSVKVLVDPSTGQVPAAMSDALLHEGFNCMNRWLANTWRGYRVSVVDLDTSGNFKRIGSLNDTTGPGKWYANDLKNNDAQRAQFENQAKANKTQFGWNDYAINIYINNGDFSCAEYPWSGHDIVISAYNLLLEDLVLGRSGALGYQVGGNLLHEIGHFNGLVHTFPDDGITDTAPDPMLPNYESQSEAAIRNSITQHNWAKNYSDPTLTGDQLNKTDNTANNAMSYYRLFWDNSARGYLLTDAQRYGPTRFVFTDEQLDRFAGYANVERRNVSTGVTRFVDAAASSGGNGSSSSPYKTLAAGISAAPVGSDIVLLRPGNYTATTLSSPVTIRVSRPGSATITHP